jgi:hypothetical protein
MAVLIRGKLCAACMTFVGMTVSKICVSDEMDSNMFLFITAWTIRLIVTVRVKHPVLELERVVFIEQQMLVLFFEFFVFGGQ